MWSALNYGCSYCKYDNPCVYLLLRADEGALKCIKISISSRWGTGEIVRYALLFPLTVGVGLNISYSSLKEKKRKPLSVRQE